jgi:hypothetical protein
MQLRRHLWLMWFFLGLSLAACAGGSGSSGFDNFPSSENAAIQTALDDQRCVSFHRLNICPADTGAAAPTTATPTPTEMPSATPTAIASIPSPLTTATATPKRQATATPPPTPTPTPTLSAPRVDTGINDAAIPCAPIDSGDGCVLVVPFAPEGFPSATVFRVAIRTVDPPGVWDIGPDLVPSGPSTSPVFDAPAAVENPTGAPDEPQQVQVAVLAFLQPPETVPASVETLADSGADYAFVTADLTLQPAAPVGEP